MFVKEIYMHLLHLLPGPPVLKIISIMTLPAHGRQIGYVIPQVNAFYAKIGFRIDMGYIDSYRPTNLTWDETLLPMSKVI